MGNSKEKIVADVRFIFDEAVRIQEVAKTGKLRDLPKEDLWGDLPHPSGNGALMCGMKAHSKLSELAALAIQKADLSGRVELNRATKKLAEVLVRRFLVEGQPIDISRVERSLSEVGRWLRKGVKDISHLIPCNLMLSKAPTELSIGPVTFFHRTAFRSRLAQSVLDARANEQIWNREILSETIKYYSKFGWVGEVCIQGCDRRSSERIAEQSILSALNCIQLVFGEQYTNKMEVGGPSRSWERSGRLQHSSSGQLWYSGTSSGQGQVGFGEDWSKLWFSDDVQHCVELFGIALAIQIDPNRNNSTASRFMDAAMWFGEAVSEKNAGAKVVKLVTAVERLFMTNEKDDIADLVSDRVAGFRMQAFLEQDFCKLKAETKELYDLRSHLVHGSLSPVDKLVVRSAHSTSEWARLSLLSGLVILGAKDQFEDEMSTKQLAKLYHSIVENYKPTDDSA